MSERDRESSRRESVCAVCGVESAPDDLLPITIVRPAVLALIRLDHPSVDERGKICRADLQRYRVRYIEVALEADRGELTNLDRSVLESMERHEVMVREVENTLDANRSLGERVADRVATFGGSWTFIGFFFLILLLWVAANAAWLAARPFDPYPFILLNLILSCLAAIQAPVIMMSQNRQDARDRLRAENDYRVNLKAELEIRHLHSKIDNLSHQWQRLAEIQQLQMEMLGELAERHV